MRPAWLCNTWATCSAYRLGAKNLAMDVSTFMKSVYSTAGSCVHLLLDESTLTIAPAKVRGLEKLLTYVEKKMSEKNQKIEKISVPMYQRLDSHPGMEVLQTHQGFWKKVVEHVEGQGLQVRMHDIRLKFPAPDFSRMHGMRFSQEPLLK